MVVINVVIMVIIKSCIVLHKPGRRHPQAHGDQGREHVLPLVILLGEFPKFGGLSGERVA